MVTVKIKRLSKDAIVPRYAHPGDAGLDIYSAEDCLMQPGSRHSFSMGIAIEIPDGYVGLVWDKSGLAHKHGLHCLGGVLDSGYRGELIVVMLNTGLKAYEVKKGDKLAQLLIQPVERAEVKEAETLSQTVRDQGGLGSTGR